MTSQDPHGVTTGFQAARHCWKCFKENEALTLIDGKPMNLCKGCLYTLKQLTQWLEAYGLKIRVIQYALDDVVPSAAAPQHIVADASQGKGEDEVVKGKVSKNGKGAEDPQAIVEVTEKV